MANIRDLKKDVNYVLGDLIETVYAWELANPSADTASSEAIIDEAIAVFDDLVAKINAKPEGDLKSHYKGIRNELETKARGIADKINAL